MIQTLEKTAYKLESAKSKVALITGITGQDGSFLAELLLGKDYEVHGLIRRSATDNKRNIEHLKDRIYLHYGDMTSDIDLYNIIGTTHPHEIYHLAAQSDVGISFENPIYTIEATAVGTAKLLETVRYLCPNTKIYNAASTEMFGNSPPKQNENTPMIPRSPYGCSKLMSYNLCNIYRDAYKMFICSGILGNHESERRGLNFVTRKITHAVAMIKQGKQKSLQLGNLEAKRDWGYAKDYVQAMWMMMQQDKPDNFAIGTGEAHTIREFADEAFKYVGLDYIEYVIVNSEFYRPAEVNYLCVDSSKARRVLGWMPMITFKSLVEIMVESDLNNV
jgi:GDPmannose 4,6-dehydratase